MRRLLIGLVALIGLSGCTGTPTETPSSAPVVSRPATSEPTTTPTPTTTSPPAIRPPELLLTRTGTGATTVSARVPGQVRSVTIRFTCIGSGATELRSTKGARLLGTLGCMQGVIYSSFFARTARRDPRGIRIKVEPDVQWAIEVWAGKYVQHVTGTAGPTI